jgi:hypothetical protein
MPCRLGSSSRYPYNTTQSIKGPPPLQQLLLQDSIETSGETKRPDLLLNRPLYCINRGDLEPHFPRMVIMPLA